MLPPAPRAALSGQGHELFLAATAKRPKLLIGRSDVNLIRPAENSIEPRFVFLIASAEANPQNLKPRKKTVSDTRPRKEGQ